MKRVLAFILAFLIALCNCGVAFTQSYATPTDIESPVEYIEFEDDDFGHIEEVEPRVFIEMSPEYVRMYDEITLTAILMDIPEEHYIEWECSSDCEHWIIIEGEHEQTYLFILTPENMGQYYRVKVTF